MMNKTQWIHLALIASITALFEQLPFMPFLGSLWAAIVLSNIIITFIEQKEKKHGSITAEQRRIG